MLFALVYINSKTFLPLLGKINGCLKDISLENIFKNILWENKKMGYVNKCIYDIG